MTLAFEFKEGANRPRAVDDTGRPRKSDDGAWPRPSRSGGIANAWIQIVALFWMAFNLVVPVLLLLSLLAASCLYADTPAPFMHGGPVSAGELLLPLSWFALHLTNRRFGPGHAFAQLVAGLVAIVLITAFNPRDIDRVMHVTFDLRAALAFGTGFSLASFVGITIFDGARGPHWWTAPLFGSLAASLVFSALYYPIAFAGTDAGWSKLALDHCGVFVAEAFLLLVPYWGLRATIRPLSGLNGF